MDLLDGRLRFAEGRLIAFEATRVVALRAWPDPGVWTGPDERSCNLPVHLRLGLADIDLKAQGGDLEAAGPCRSLLATVPSDFGEDALRFPEHGWRLLALVWSAPGALDLVRSNPALAFSIACASDLKTKADGTWPSGQDLVRRKREEIAGWLEFPATRSSCNVLERMMHEVITLRGLRALRGLVHSKDPRVRKLLLHVPHINADVLEFLTDEALVYHVTPSLLEEASFIRSREPHVAERVRGAIQDWSALMPGAATPVVRTMRELEALLDRVRGLENHRRICRVKVAGPLPSPPIPGDGNIQPITSVDGLVDEGIAQKNCAGDYGAKVRAGSIYLYRVMAPERCTLSLERTPTGWRLEQLRASCNRTASPAVRSVVDRWLERSRGLRRG